VTQSRKAVRGVTSDKTVKLICKYARFWTVWLQKTVRPTLIPPCLPHVPLILTEATAPCSQQMTSLHIVHNQTINWIKHWNASVAMLWFIRLSREIMRTRLLFSRKNPPARTYLITLVWPWPWPWPNDLDTRPWPR